MSRAWFLWLALAACSSSKSLPPPSNTAKPVCLADKLGTLDGTNELDPACTEDQSCEEKCSGGDAHACMFTAFDVQDARGESQPLFARACTQGLAIGCTNYGAGIGMRAATNADEICARKLFEKACAVREPWGCGMLGRAMASNARTPAEQDAARRHFDASCNALGGITCRMYALHLEQGHLGRPQPATVRALMLRACETGDRDACGHDTAGETFR